MEIKEKTGSKEMSDGDINLEYDLSFIHFNDVYNVVPNKVEPVGGASRFVHLIKSLKESNPNTLLLFSGDIFAPSGEQMIPVIDEMKIDIACVGNHDYDFGRDGLTNLISKLKFPFPWLLSNLFDSKNGKPLQPGIESYIIIHNGLKIGFMGLIEYDWVLTQSALKPSEYIYEDFIVVAKKFVIYFKNENCDLIIALTHMRNYNDINLSDAVPEIDFILGGHDHDYFYNCRKSNLILKSGTDFRELTFNKVKIVKFVKPSDNYGSVTKNISESKTISVITKGSYQLVVESEYLQITQNMKKDESMEKLINLLESQTEEKFKIVIGHLASPVDVRFSMVRNQSIPISNLIADLVNIYMDTDITIINSGSLRIDSIINEGELNFGMLKRLLPGDYTLVRVRIKGDQIWKTLENGISKFPALEGRFPIISNITFTFDRSKKAFKRINADSIFIKGEKLQLDQDYTLSTRVYTYQGYDGYDELPNCKNLDFCELETIFDVVLKYFEIVKPLNENFLITCNEECCQIFPPGIFGLSKTNKHLIEYLHETVIFEDDTPLVMISSMPRIHQL